MINWIKVEDRLPPSRKDNKEQSIMVLAIDVEDGVVYNIEYTYCFLKEKTWLSDNEPTHWAYISDINLPIE